MNTPAAAKRLIEVYQHASVVRSGERLTTVNELADQIPATRWDTLVAAVQMITALGSFRCNKLLSEEDKGAMLAGLLSVQTGLPIAMARWYSYPIPSPYSVVVPIDMEYAKGQLLVNGIMPGDHLTIVDDTLSTGGTAVSLIRAARLRGAVVDEMRVVVEKLGFGGRERIGMENVPVKAGIGISVIDSHIRVEQVLGQVIQYGEGGQVLCPEQL